jgi:hypothetical protein
MSSQAGLEHWESSGDKDKITKTYDVSCQGEEVKGGGWGPMALRSAYATAPGVNVEPMFTDFSLCWTEGALLVSASMCSSAILKKNNYYKYIRLTESAQAGPGSTHHHYDRPTSCTCKVSHTAMECR